MEEALLVYVGYTENNKYVPRMFMIARREQDVESHLNRMMDEDVYKIINDFSQHANYDTQL